MPFTHRDYSIMEVAILGANHAPMASGHERAVEGDIITIRHPLNGIGLSEMARFLWMRVEGEDIGNMIRFKHELREPLKENGSYEDGEPTFDKRRFCIPLRRLKNVFPPLDIDRVRDLNDTYQPFLNVDEDTGLYLARHSPFPIIGLVYDKALQRLV